MQKFKLYSRVLGARAPDPDSPVARASAACRARGSDSVSISMRAHALPLAASWPPAGCLPASQPFQLSLSSVHDRFCKQPRSFYFFFMHGGILGGSDLKIYDFLFYALDEYGVWSGLGT